MTNISETGAQLSIMKHFRLPETFFLHESRMDNVMECTTVWRRDDCLGFRFVDMCGMATRRRLISAIMEDKRAVRSRIAFDENMARIA